MDDRDRFGEELPAAGSADCKLHSFNGSCEYDHGEVQAATATPWTKGQGLVDSDHDPSRGLLLADRKLGMDLPHISPAARDPGTSETTAADHAAARSFDETLKQADRSPIERLPAELLQNVAQRLPGKDLAHLSEASRTTHEALQPHLMEAEVTAFAQKADTLPQLRQLAGEDALQQDHDWNPRHNLQDLSPAQQVRPLLVMASRVKQLPDAEKAEAEQVIRRQPTLVDPQEMDLSMGSDMGAAVSLVGIRGASVPDAYSLFGLDKGRNPEQARRLLEVQGIDSAEEGVRSGADPNADAAASRLGLSDTGRERLASRLAANPIE